MATDYTNIKEYPKFGSFVRAVIGLPYAPLERLEEAVDVLKKLARAVSGQRRKFCCHMLKYLRKTWLDGGIPRQLWNMYQHRGVTTNNHAEAFNLKWGQKRKYQNIQIHMY